MKKANYWEVKRKISMLRELAKAKASSRQYVPLIKSAYTGIRTPAITIKNENLYRSRWNEGTELFMQVNDLSYPSKKLVRKKGRLNDVGSSVLYAAACELGTIIESRPTVNKLFTIASISPLNAELLYFPLGITDKGYYDGKYSGAEKLLAEYVNSEITRWVTDEEEYNLTIALAEHFLKSNILDVSHNGSIVYPSVQGSKIANKTTYNFAILPEVFNANFKISGATTYCLTNEKSHYQLNPLNETTKISSHGELSWQFTKAEMLERISLGLTIDGTQCENIRTIST